MPRAKRADRIRSPQTDKPADDKPVVEPHGNTTVATANFEENDADAVAPMNPRIRLRLVCAFKLELVTRNKTGDAQYDRIEGEGIHERMTERDIAGLCGPGTYRATWYKLSKALSNVGRSVYGTYEFTLRAPPNGDGSIPANGAGIALQPAPGRPNALAADERLVPAGFDGYMHEWVFSQLDVARQDRGELFAALNKSFDVLSVMTQRNAEMATQNVALAGQLVMAMREAGKVDMDSRIKLSENMLDARMQLIQAMNGGGMEKVIGMLAQRLGDRFLPADGSKPSQITNTLDKVDKTMPKLDRVANDWPQIQAQMGEMVAFMREAKPALRQLAAMTGGGDAAAMAATDAAVAPDVAPAPAAPAPAVDAAPPDSADV